MGNYNPVYKTTWSDPRFAELEPLAKLVYLNLITNERTQHTGIYQIRPQQIACDCGIDIEEIQKILKKLEEVMLIKFWWELNQVYIFGHFKIAKGMIKTSTTLMGCTNRQRDLIKNPEAWKMFDNEYQEELKLLQKSVNKSLMKNQINKSNNNNDYMDRNNDEDNNKDKSNIMTLKEIVHGT